LSIRAIGERVVSEKIIHRAEHVPGWRSSEEGPEWRSLCGVRVGAARRRGEFEFEVSVAIDPQSWRLAANCPACRAASERRDLGALI
jgi:hypothetical protein